MDQQVRGRAALNLSESQHQVRQGLDKSDRCGQTETGPGRSADHAVSSNRRGIPYLSRVTVGRRVAQLGEEKMQEVCRALGFALACER